MTLHSLEDLYIEQLRDLYDAEQQLVDALPKMRRAANLPELRDAFEHHLEQTREHVQRLEQVFKNLDTSPKGEKCQAMKGLIKESEQLMNKKANAPVLDAALIASAQRVEHYEIAGYGTLRTWAQQLGRQEDVQLLQEILKEEGETDEKLTQLAETTVNAKAS